MLIASYESSSTSLFVFIEQYLSTDWHLITFIGCGQGCHGGFKVQFRVSNGTISYVLCTTDWCRLASIAKLLIINAMRMRKKSTERECDVFVVIAWWEDRVFLLLFSLFLFRFSDATTKIVYFPVDHCKEDFGLLIPLRCRTRQSIALYLSEISYLQNM